jgi:hypothetical protein
MPGLLLRGNAACTGCSEPAPNYHALMQNHVVQRRYLSKADFELARQKLRDHGLRPAINFDRSNNGQVRARFIFSDSADAEFAEVVLGP